MTVASDTDSETEAVGQFAQIQDLLVEVLAGWARSRLTDLALVEMLGALEGVGRVVDSARVSSVSDLARRAEIDYGGGSLVKGLGCRNPVDVVTSITRVSVREAKRRITLGGGDRKAGGERGLRRGNPPEGSAQEVHVKTRSAPGLFGAVPSQDLHHECGTTDDHAVPDPSELVVADLAGQHDASAALRPQVLDIFRTHRLRVHG